jgi:hypothetical protein
MAPLEFSDFPESIQTQEGGFSTVPGKPDRFFVGCGYMLNDQPLKKAFGHHPCLAIGEKDIFIQIVAVGTPEITSGTCGFDKDLECIIG